MLVPSPTKIGYSLQWATPFFLIFKDQCSLHYPCTTSHSTVTRQHSREWIPHPQSSAVSPFYMGIADTRAQTPEAMTSIWAVNSTLHHHIASQSWPCRGPASLQKKLEEILVRSAKLSILPKRLTASLSGGRSNPQLCLERTRCISAERPSYGSLSSCQVIKGRLRCQWNFMTNSNSKTSNTDSPWRTNDAGDTLSSRSINMALQMTRRHTVKIPRQVSEV